MSKDRFSIHQESGVPQLIQEAFIIMRDGGTEAQSGLIGITNRGYAEGGEPHLPETIFNVQSSGLSNIRFSSGPAINQFENVRSSVQILGNGNMHASGLELVYLPENDGITIVDCPSPPCDNDPTYLRYTITPCGGGLSVQVYDSSPPVSPSVGDVVEYTDANGNTGLCGTVNNINASNNKLDNSSIQSNFGSSAEACDTCQGNGVVVVYEVIICGTSTTIYVSDTAGFTPSPTDVVKFNYEGDPTCGTVQGAPQIGTANADIQGIVPAGCGDPVCSPPETTLKWNYTVCTGEDDAGQTGVVEDTSNKFNLTGKVVKVPHNGTSQCVTIGTSTTDAATITHSLTQVYNDCTACGAPATITTYVVDICTEDWNPAQCSQQQTNIQDPLNLGPFNQNDVVKVYLNPGDHGLCGGFFCATIVSDFQTATAYSSYIESTQTSCADCANEVTNYIYTIDECPTDSLSDDTLTISSNAFAVDEFVKYSVDGGTTDKCGKILTKTTTTNAVDPNDSIGETYLSCTPCQNSLPGGYCEFIKLRFYLPVEDQPVCDAGCIDPGELAPPPPPGSCGDCDDCCFYIDIWAGNDICCGSLSVDDVVTFVITEDGAESSFAPYGYMNGDEYCAVVIRIETDSDNAEGPIEAELSNCASCTESNNAIVSYCVANNCGTDVGSYIPLPDPLTAGDVKNFTIDVGDSDEVIADISLVRPTGVDGIEFGHQHFTKRGYVGIGLTKIGDYRNFTANAPLTVAYIANGHRDSGTISMHEQTTQPNINADYGKIYIKPYTGLGGTQSIYFSDDGGNEYNLLEPYPQPNDDCCELIQNYQGPSGMVYGDIYGNTYAGWHTPTRRVATSTINNNTYFGWAAGFDLGSDDGNIQPDDNTLVGYVAGSGLNDAQKNTVIGSQSLKNYEASRSMTVVGYNNVSSTLLVPVTDPVVQPMSGIIIGTNLFSNIDPPIGALYIGHSTFPVVTGQLADLTDRTFAVDDATFIVSTGDSNFTINHAFGSHYDVRLTARDETNTLDKAYRNSINVNFSNAGDFIFNMAEFNPSGAERANVPTYANQGFNYMQLNSDFRLQGAIRFQDGSSCSGVPFWLDYDHAGTSGVNIVDYGATKNRWFVLNYTGLQLAEAVAQNVTAENTFVSVQVDGTDSDNMGKMSLAGLASYVADGFITMSENCNVIITDEDNEENVNAAINSQSVMIGCDVATYASGWKNSVIIGTEAGQNATTPNPLLDMDTASIFIGYKAGRDCDNVDNVIAIGSNAGNNSDGASDSIFIGSSAGINSNFKDSVGIGANALREANGVGSGNIEIIANFLDNQSLFYNAGTVDYRLNIQNSIAGNTDARNISIGAARLSPESPLEVRRDSNVHAANTNNYIQSWVCDNSVVGAVECDGSLSGFFVEGLLDGNLTAPANISSPTSATLSVYINGVDTTQNVTVTNRNPNFSASSTDYLIAMKIGGEYRPIN
jgi:hypothetical protein